MITEVVGGASSGRTTLAHALVSAAVNAGELAAWIDLPNALDFDDAYTRDGGDLERLLWVRPYDAPTAFRAAEQVLDVEGFRLVVLDLDLPSRKAPIGSSAVWLRLMHAAVRREAALVILGQARLTAFAGLCLETSRRRCAFEDQTGPCPFFRGMATGIHLTKCKFGMLSPTAFDLFVTATP